MNPTLSICIATRNRANYLTSCLNSIINQNNSIEVVVVDGASTDNTENICKIYKKLFKSFIYKKLEINGGIDQDYSLSIRYASGKYCWLFSDDDIIRPESINKILFILKQCEYEFLVINSVHMCKDMLNIVDENRLKINKNKFYSAKQKEEIFTDLCGPLGLISCLIVRREFWLSKDTHRYIGTYFNHIGILFQSSITLPVLLVSDTLFMVRQGNLSWSNYAFKIWLLNFPKLVWSFNQYSYASKKRITDKRPWISFVKLFGFRGLGYFNYNTHNNFIKRYKNHISLTFYIYSFLLSLVPQKFCSISLYIILILFRKKSKTTIYDLKNSSFLKGIF